MKLKKEITMLSVSHPGSATLYAQIILFSGFIILVVYIPCM